MTKEEFNVWLAAIPEKEHEPFCPFGFFGYCDVAYTKKCWPCEWVDKEPLEDWRSVLKEIFNERN
ncbi:MAG: hypothetical protein J6S85_17670 [Methanobrevibacter sp.]|nr:hypothetical protein [Methanobrevibacter sp.]